MFVVAFEGAWLVRRLIVLWVPEVVFVFGFDTGAVERLIAETCFELAFTK
jgi:hypothetical protein